MHKHVCARTHACSEEKTQADCARTEETDLQGPDPGCVGLTVLQVFVCLSVCLVQVNNDIGCPHQNAAKDASEVCPFVPGFVHAWPELDGEHWIGVLKHLLVLKLHRLLGTVQF